jgi:hypothetical protein
VIHRIPSSLILHLLYCIFYIIVSECEQTFYYIFFKHIVHISGHPSSQCTRAGGRGGGVSSREQRWRARSRRGGGLGELDRGLGRGEPFFSDTDSDSDEAFQISHRLGLVHVEFFCVLVQQPCFMYFTAGCILLLRQIYTMLNLSISSRAFSLELDHDK